MRSPWLYVALTLPSSGGRGGHRAPHSRPAHRANGDCIQAFTDAVYKTRTGSLDGHAFAEWRFDLVHHTH